MRASADVVERALAARAAAGAGTVLSLGFAAGCFEKNDVIAHVVSAADFDGTV